jgi:predicted PurR-regulated permease PerM
MVKNIAKSQEATERDEESRYEAAEVTQVAESIHIRSLALPGIFLILIFAVLKLANEFFVPVALALLLKFLFASVIRGLSRFHIPEPVGAAAVLLALVGSLGFGIYQLAMPATEWMEKFPQTMRQIESKLKSVKQSVQKVSQASQEVEKLTDLASGGEKTQKVEVKKSSVGATLVEPTQAFLVGAGVTLILFFFLLASGDLFLRKLVSVLPSLRDKKLAVEISHQIEHDVSKYLLAITIINAFFGAAIATAMYFLGLPNPILWGVMAGFLHFIPFLGAAVGIIVVTMVAVVTLASTAMIALVPISYFGLNLLEEYIVVPLIIGRRLMLNPVVIFLWLIFWGWLWGVPGALMAVPLLAIVKIICEHVESLSPVAEFLGQ